MSNIEIKGFNSEDGSPAIIIKGFKTKDERSEYYREKLCKIPLKKPHSDEEIINFAEYCGEHYNRTRIGWMNKAEVCKGVYHTILTSDLLSRFRKIK